MQYEEDQKHYLLARMAVYLGLRVLGLGSGITLLLIVFHYLLPSHKGRTKSKPTMIQVRHLK
jgi:hypothetical protein